MNDIIEFEVTAACKELCYFDEDRECRSGQKSLPLKSALTKDSSADAEGDEEDHIPEYFKELGHVAAGNGLIGPEQYDFKSYIFGCHAVKYRKRKDKSDIEDEHGECQARS